MGETGSQEESVNVGAFFGGRLSDISQGLYGYTYGGEWICGW